MKTYKLLFVGFFTLAIIVGTFSKGVAQQKEELKEVKFWVSMHCESCKKKIERDIAFEKGVKSIIVDLKEKTVTVKYNAEKNTDDKIAEAIRKLGYEVTILKNEEKKK